MAEQLKIEAPVTDKDELAGSEAPLLDHLIELRKRLIRSMLVILGLLIVVIVLASNRGIFGLLDAIGMRVRRDRSAQAPATKPQSAR